MSDDSQTVMKRLTITIVFVFLELMGGMALAADPPCDTYPAAKQPRCSEIWKDLYKEDGPVIAQFGLDHRTSLITWTSSNNQPKNGSLD